MGVKTLIVYYSRSGSSETFAKALQSKLSCDIDKLEYASKKRVPVIKAIIESLCKRTADITGAAHDPGAYDRIVFVTPVWGSGLSTPIRSYMVKNKNAIKSYALAAICGGGGLAGTVAEARRHTGSDPLASKQFTSAQIARGKYDAESCLP